MITLGIKDQHTFLDEVNKRSGCNILECYQCGKCSGTCPVSMYMDITPRQVMQFVKLGMKDEVLVANSSWFCFALPVQLVRDVAHARLISPESWKRSGILPLKKIFLQNQKK